MENTNIEYKDYKYIMDDLSRLQIGSHFTYKELADNEDLSYKYRSIIKRFIEREVEEDTTLESHFYYLQKDSNSNDIYKRLKTKVRSYIPTRKKRFGGGFDTVYKEELMDVADFCEMTPEIKKNKGLMIAEIQMSKVGLMTYAM